MKREFVAIDKIDINLYSWSPTPQADVDAGKPQGPATQVHMHVDVGDDITLVFRFKGPGTLDRLIAGLKEHREDVWGPTS